MKGAKEIIVTLGSSNLENKFTPGLHVTKIGHENIYIYPNYVGFLLWNDIGLIRLDHAVKFTKYIRPINLPKICESIENIEVVAMGNGKTENNAVDISYQLQYAILKTIPAEICKRNFPILFWRKTVVCGKSPSGQSVCYGDSGKL